MSLLECIRLAANSLLANKLRALLTMLGIIIGISSVIIITTLGKSVSKTLEYSFNSLGFNQLFVYAFEEMEVDDDGSTSFTILEGFMNEDLVNEFIEETNGRFIYLKHTEGGSGAIENFKNETVSTEITGIAANNLSANNYKMIMGREISQRDVLEERHSIVVTDIFVKQYFRENENPIGKTIDLVINDGVMHSFTIVGVAKAHAEEKRLMPGQKFIDLRSTVYIPYTTASILSDEGNEFMWNARFSIAPEYEHDESVAILKSFFNEKLRQFPNGTLEISDMAEDMKIVNVVLAVITVVFTLIAMISLLVGGIGVMNIMLVSITERTREIGVRKAMGAKNGSIRLQFVVEAIMICVVGGIIGILLGVGEGFLVKAIADVVIKNFYAEANDYITLVVSPSVIAMVGSVLFCMATGVFFGLYPANKAAKMNPIDALRYD